MTAPHPRVSPTRATARPFTVMLRVPLSTVVGPHKGQSWSCPTSTTAGIEPPYRFQVREGSAAARAAAAELGARLTRSSRLTPVIRGFSTGHHMTPADLAV